MELNLTGKKVLVTGASQGIGQALAESFAREGCDLTVVARSGERLQALASDLLKRYGVSTRVITLDMTEPGAIKQLLNRPLISIFW